MDMKDHKINLTELTQMPTSKTSRFICSQLFCDFGEEFEVLDQNGEPPETALIQRVLKVKSSFQNLLLHLGALMGDSQNYVQFTARKHSLYKPCSDLTDQASSSKCLLCLISANGILLEHHYKNININIKFEVCQTDFFSYHVVSG